MDRYQIAAATTKRKARQRARETWSQLQYEGWESLEELLSDLSECNVPESYQGRKLESGITKDDLLPSRKAVETMTENLKK